MKKSFLTKLLALMLLSLTICLSLFGCGKSDSKKEGNENEGEIREPVSYVDDLYPERKALAKIKVNAVSEEVYYTYDSLVKKGPYTVHTYFSWEESGLHKYLKLSCTVIEDYYNHLKAGEEIILMISVSDGFKTLQALEEPENAAIEEEIRRKLLSVDSLLVSTSITDQNKSYMLKGSDNFVRLDCNYGFIKYMEEFPLCDKSYEYYTKWYRNYDKYFWDGMSEEKLAENAKKLYSDIKNNTVAGE